jgi:hypothetical protein
VKAFVPCASVGKGLELAPKVSFLGADSNCRTGEGRHFGGMQCIRSREMPMFVREGRLARGLAHRLAARGTAVPSGVP